MARIMLRKTLTILSLVGLLLCVGLWGVSYWEPYYRTEESTLWASKGRFGLSNLGIEVVFSVEIEKWRGFQGFETDWLPYYSEDIQPFPYWSVGIPLWMPTFLFLAIFWLSLLPLHRRRKRKKLGLCIKCGYDLRASKERCPECGEGIESSG